MKKENENISWDLWAKDVSGELSPEEYAILQKEMAANPDIEKQVRELWGEARYAQELKTIDADTAWKTVKTQLSGLPIQRKLFNYKTYGSIAALFAVILTSVFFIKTYLSEPTFTTIHTSEAIESVVLPDGTKVDVNHGSTLIYPDVFDGDTRQVKLVGEAFFDVVRNEDNPFVIETQDLSVRVLGTSFNVKAYANSESTEVTVSTGKVSVGTKTALQHVILEAGDAATYSKTGNFLEKTKVYTGNYKAWKTKEIEFNNTRLAKVFKTIEDVYHISIEVDSMVHIEEEVLDATFSHHTLEHVMRAVCTSFNLKYEEVDGKYFISERY